MIHFADMARLAAVASILTLAIGAGTAFAAPEPIRVSATETSTVPADSAASKVLEATAPDASSPCTRKVKVVYAGYGEASRAGCPSTSAR